MKTLAVTQSTSARVSPGEPLTLTLQGVPTAGYAWQLETGEGVELVAQGAEPHAAVVGGASTESFTLRATRPGTHSVKLIYKRPWESAVESELTVDIIAE